MRINLHNARRQPLFVVDIDPGNPPSMVRPTDGDGQAVHLDWDRAMDDKHHLRRCPVCGCDDLYVRKLMPQITTFAMILIAAVVAMVIMGFNEVGWAVVLLGVMLGVDLGIYLFSPRMMVCYRCRSTFRKLPIRADHPRWDRTLGERYRHVGPTPSEPVDAAAKGDQTS